MSAVGHDPQLGAQPARVLEGVVDRHLVIPRAPEHERRTTDKVELEPGIVLDEDPSGRRGVGVQPRRSKKAFDRFRSQRSGSAAPQYPKTR